MKRRYKIGVRLIDKFLAKSNVSTPGACADLREAADVIAKVRQKRFPAEWRTELKRTSAHVFKAPVQSPVHSFL